jgi:hypothetical protein
MGQPYLYTGSIFNQPNQNGGNKMNAVNRRVQVAGMVYVAGGAMWFLLIVGATALGISYDEPHTSPFYVAEAIFVILQALLLAGFFGIWWSDGVGRSTFGKIAFGSGALGHIFFVLFEAYGLIMGDLPPVFPLAPLTSAVGILLTGIAVLMVKQWQGWTRWVPLLTGLYPWLFMFPFVLITGEPSNYAIGLWGLVRLALGLAIYAQAATMSQSSTEPAI